MVLSLSTDWCFFAPSFPTFLRGNRVGFRIQLEKEINGLVEDHYVEEYAKAFAGDLQLRQFSSVAISNQM